MEAHSNFPLKIFTQFAIVALNVTYLKQSGFGMCDARELDIQVGALPTPEEKGIRGRNNGKCKGTKIRK